MKMCGTWAWNKLRWEQTKIHHLMTRYPQRAHYFQKSSQNAVSEAISSPYESSLQWGCRTRCWFAMFLLDKSQPYKSREGRKMSRFLNIGIEVCPMECVFLEAPNRKDGLTRQEWDSWVWSQPQTITLHGQLNSFIFFLWKWRQIILHLND